MLAYVFWHRTEGDVAAYEDGMRAFHAALAADPPAGFHGSVTFARERQPWFDGYEDWYLIGDWAALGVLNAAAPTYRSHDAVAVRAAAGAAAVYRHESGGLPLGDTRGTTWSDAPLEGDATWRRQLVLGPAPQYCAHHARGDRRVL